MKRHQSERCNNCGRELTWIERVFGRFNDPICGRCLTTRRAKISILLQKRRGRR